MNAFRLPSPAPLARVLWLALALAVAPTASVGADEPPAKEISEELAEKLGELRPLLDAKKHTEAAALVGQLLGQAKPESYDFVILTQLQSQLLLTEGKLQEAVTPLEQSVAVAERHGFLPPATIFDQLHLLAQLYNQRAMEAKQPAAQQAAFGRALDYLQRATPLATKPVPELHLLAASLYYNQGTLGGAPDPEKFRHALAAAKRGLLSAVKPPEQLHQLMLASYQQLGELEPAAETLELLLHAKPQNAQSWNQLIALYMNLATAAKDDRERDRWNLRAILSIERAQALGLLRGIAENYTLVALNFTLQDYARAAELLEKGLPAGALENQKRNWELLANCYTQLNEPDRALDALRRATGVFPTDGQLEFAIAQLHYTHGRVAEARHHAQVAADKGNLEKPGQTFLYLAYLSYELGELETAARWLDRAADQSDVKPAEIAPIRRAVSDAMKERAALPKA